MVLEFLPLVLVLLVVATLALGVVSSRIRVRVAVVAYRLFGTVRIEADAKRRRRLRMAGIGTPYRVYASTTYLYASAAAVVGTVLGVYLGAAFLRFVGVAVLADRVPDGPFRSMPTVLFSLSVQGFLVLAVASLAVGVLAAGAVYFVRWQLPAFRADTRRRYIDAAMPRTVAFVYALSRGGMSFPDVMRALSVNREVFGAAAEEMTAGVRDIDLLGADVVTAVRDLSRRTPSDGFRNFTENLASVLRSGGNLSRFLEAEYRRYRDEAEERQEEILELLAATAEVYVTVVVAGMLFLITILLVIGLTSGDTLVLVRLITYVVLPATNVLFLAYLSEITQPLRAGRDRTDPERSTEPPTHARPGGSSEGDGASAADPVPEAVADGGTVALAADAANRQRLRAYRQLRSIRAGLGSPIRSLLARPELVFYLTVPFALGYVVVSLPSAFDGGFAIGVLDDVVVQAALLVMGAYALVYEAGSRRLIRMEASIPDLLERLASLNEAGISVVSSFDRVRETDVGALDREVERIWRDIQWGATVDEALDGFGARVETPAVTRIVTLLTNAMRASNDIGPVLRIAAEQARSDLRLRRQRRQEMFTYLVVIYVSFLVFVVVIGAIDTVLIPNLPEAPTTDGYSVGGLLQMGTTDVEGYRLAFFHAALIQAALSGLVGGQMGEGSVKDGVKHATIMLGATYAVFVALQSVTVLG
ncbi:MAG: type II secretion system F family protein [Haloarculaceae archaeon]